MLDGLFKNNARGGVYYGAYTAKDGTRKQFSTGSKNEREARRIFQSKLQAVWDDEDRPKLKLTTLSSFTEEFLACKKGEGVSESQLKELRASLCFLERAIGDVPLHTVTIAQCERFVTRGWQPNGWPSLWTARKHYTNLKSAFSAAQRWQHVRENPFDHIKKPKPEERMPEIFTRHELGLLLDELEGDPRLRNVVLLIANSGLRLGEVLNLQRRDVEWSAGLIQVRAKKGWSPKGRKPRVVPISEDAQIALRSQFLDNARSLNERVQSSLSVFPGPHGLRLTHSVIEHPFKRACEKLFPGRELHPHSLRHSFASWLYEASVPLQVIQKILGHRSLRTTEIYARLRNNDFSIALTVLNAHPSLVRASYITPEAFEAESSNEADPSFVLANKGVVGGKIPYPISS